MKLTDDMRKRMQRYQKCMSVSRNWLRNITPGYHLYHIIQPIPYGNGLITTNLGFPYYIHAIKHVIVAYYHLTEGKQTTGTLIDILYTKKEGTGRNQKELYEEANIYRIQFLADPFLPIEKLERISVGCWFLAHMKNYCPVARWIDDLGNRREQKFRNYIIEEIYEDTMYLRNHAHITIRKPVPELDCDIRQEDVEMYRQEDGLRELDWILFQASNADPYVREFNEILENGKMDSSVLNGMTREDQVEYVKYCVKQLHTRCKEVIKKMKKL